MIFKPKLNRYNINALIALADNVNDEYTKSKIKMAMVDKLLSYDYPMLYLINKFMTSRMILKEVYADLILIKMKEDDYYIDNVLVDELLRYASLDALMYYGTETKNYEFNIRCKEEFYRRGREFEDKIEFQRKRTLDNEL